MESPVNINQEEKLDKTALMLIFGALAILIGAIIFVMSDSNKNIQEATSQATQSAAVLEKQQGSPVPSTVPITEIKELQKIDLVVGMGLEATPGTQVSVHYTGTFVDGRKFDSSLDRGQLFQFSLGAGQVIRGWDLGVLGMKVGGKRKLLIPSNLAYGENGASGAIPPNTPLIFEVELLEVK